MKQRILIVDDDRNICEILEFNLKSEGYEVECVHSAEEAMAKLSPEHALILLDVMMGGMSGYKMAETLRTNGNQTPIIFITAKNTENDLLTAFSVGADDYIAKPFSIKALIARVKAVLKRRPTFEAAGHVPHRLVFNNLVVDMDVMELSIDGEKVPLTKTEFKLFAFLAAHPQRVLSREAIIEHVWSETPYITERSVDVHITRLRKKLGAYASVIVNRSGYGYRFNASDL